TRAAKQGSMIAQDNLAFIYAIGLGVPRDRVTAYMWYVIASASGHRLAETEKNLIAKEMTETEIKMAKKRAENCVKSNFKNCD
ncbi:MAG TPA: sel1 repeat family protein, partial [Nitrospinota bacterium]|nr:sel1 repeat family protein [Nitrospinota bacterium]